MVKIGIKVKDKITGFSGIVTGLVQYITGCNQALVAPTCEDNNFKQSQWIDEQRLEVVEGEPLILDNGVAPGFDKEAPTR